MVPYEGVSPALRGTATTAAAAVGPMQYPRAGLLKTSGTMGLSAMAELPGGVRAALEPQGG
jgi:hypothetical protein